MQGHRSLWALLLACTTLTMLTLPAAVGQVYSHAKWTIGQIEDPPDDAVPCPALSAELLKQHAVNNLVILTVVDRLSMKKFGKSWIKNIEAANISYAFVAALDPWTSKVLGHWGIKRCFNAPMDKLDYRGSDHDFSWGSNHWRKTTWSKVQITAAVYELGVHVIHSDADVTWFQDPMPYFAKFLDGPVHALFTSDALETKNSGGDQGLEAMTSPYININTGVYFVRQYPGGNHFFSEWLKLKGDHDDQDGLNTLVRGEAHKGDRQYPSAKMNAATRLVQCALDTQTMVSLLPVSMFGNAYTYVNGQVHKRLGHPLYEIHWVWSGSTMESKQQTMRDAMKFWDPPEYYYSPNLVTMDLWVPEPYQDFSQTPFDQTERMIQFHIYAANTQLRQAYYGFLAAMALERVFVVPKFQCFCSKNWYMTQSCRINGETHTLFPFDCSLSNIMRVKKLLHGGLHVRDGTQKGTVAIREHTFLQNPNVPHDVRKSRLVLVPADLPRSSADVSAPSTPLQERPQPDGSVHVTVPWPLDDHDLKTLLAPLSNKFRIIHFVNATKILGRGFHSPTFWSKFDATISKLTTRWCCRSPEDQAKFNATDFVNLRILPKERELTGSTFRAEYGIERSAAGFDDVPSEPQTM